mmetsp:Transcript_34147/g.54739  ORF Transcript_34147/g.54739 Transcript_34147/m.54739 type:complete len:375 (+) Transcript_34147:108-1232(+)
MALQMDNGKFCLLTGESQAGKSTIVNCIAGKNVAQIGNGSGYSVTPNTAVYSTPHQLYLMDSPGGLDTNLRADKEILQEIEYAITAKSAKTSLDVILLAESLTSDSMQIQRNLHRLRTTFGANVSKSIIVLATKPAISQVLYGQTRITAVTQECSRLGLKCMLFETYTNYQQKTMVNGAALNNQLAALKQLMKQINPYQMDGIVQVRKSLHGKAQSLMNSAPTRYKTEYFNESYSEPYTVKESYQTSEPYQAQESYSVQEPYQQAEQYWENVWDVVGKDHNVFKYGRRPKKQWGWVAVPRTRLVTKHRTVTHNRTVTKYRSVTKYRNVTKYQTKTRQKSMQVAIPKDINTYLTQAKSAWEQEMKQSLKRKVTFA